MRLHLFHVFELCLLVLFFTVKVNLGIDVLNVYKQEKTGAFLSSLMVFN